MNARLGFGVALATAVIAATAMVDSGTGVAENPSGSGSAAIGTPTVGAVFAPDTDPDYASRVLDALRSGPPLQRFDTHWNPAATALNNGGAAQGDALELTWSIIPDGTSMPSQFPGDTTCASNLIATFDAEYGAGDWQAEIQQVWDDWTGLAGNKYTPAVSLDANGTPIDDGAAWPSSPGVTGVRGDVRIGGCNIDGNSGVLAYNFYPNFGDMKIDATDSFYAGSSLTTGFHNVFSHEHGHGAGLAHVCPRDGTKLMEPTVNLGFRGLQHDDIRGVQRGYGDRFELINNPNDTSGAATPVTPSPTQTEAQLSLDSTSDTDWFTFVAAAGDTVDVTVAPNGLTYNEGPDIGSDLCDAGTDPGTPLNSLALQDLSFEIRDSSGILTTVNATPAGAGESISDFALPATGTYYVRVFGTGTNDAQLYDLTLTKNVGAPSNDLVANATSVNALPFTDTVPNTQLATTSGTDLPHSCAARVGTSTLWWSVTAPLDGRFTLDTEGSSGSYDDTVMTVYSGPPGSFVEVGCNDDGGTDLRSRIVDLPVTASTTYHVYISRWDDTPTTDAGTAVFNATFASAPSAPTGVVGVSGNAQVALSWTAPASDGGSPITGYTATAAPGGATCTTSGATGCTVSGLTNGTAYTFTVTATNAVGTGPASAASAPVIPIAPPVDGSDVVTVEPARLLDTRPVPSGSTVDGGFLGGGKLRAGTFTRVKIAGRGGVAADAVGVELNITAIQNEGRGFATLYPCTATVPTASTLNYTPGVNIANATTVALNADGEVCVFSNVTAHYALDVVAYIAA